MLKSICPLEKIKKNIKGYTGEIKNFFSKKEKTLFFGSCVLFFFSITEGQVTLGQDSRDVTKKIYFSNNDSLNNEKKGKNYYKQLPHLKHLEKNFLLEKHQSFGFRKKYQTKERKKNEQYLFNTPEKDYEKIAKTNKRNTRGHINSFTLLQDYSQNYDEDVLDTTGSQDKREEHALVNSKGIHKNIFQKSQEMQWNLLTKAEKRQRRKNNFSLENDGTHHLTKIDEEFSDEYYQESCGNDYDCSRTISSSTVKKTSKNNNNHNVEKSIATKKKKEKKNGEKKEKKMLSGDFLGINKILHTVGDRKKHSKYQDYKPREYCLPCLPVLGKISSSFGYRRHPLSKNVKMHYGVDFSAPRGTPVRSILQGVITSIGYHPHGFGHRITIEHYGKIETLYAHLNSYAKGLFIGKSIKRGEVIGYVGSSGRTSGPHLHLEYRKNNVRRNPLELFRQKLPPLGEKVLGKKETYRNISPVLKNNGMKKNKKNTMFSFLKFKGKKQ